MHNSSSSLAYHGRAPLPPPIITTAPSSTHAHSNAPASYQNQTSLSQRNQNQYTQNKVPPSLRSTSPVSTALSVNTNLTPPPPPSIHRPTSLPPPPHLQNYLQLPHQDRPLSEQLHPQASHIHPHPPNPGYISSATPEHPMENLPPRGHLLGPTPLSNDMMLELLISQAMRDASGFEILNADTVEVLKKEHDDLADQANDLVPRLTREEKIREGARNMLILYRENKTASLKAQEELVSANAKVDGCATELWKITNRRMGLQRRILQHNSAVLALGIRKMEDVVRREGKTAIPNGALSGPSGRRSVTPDEWEAREDEFQQAFKLAYEERRKERTAFETALEEKDKLIIDMREKMESLEDALKQVCEKCDVEKVPLQNPVSFATAATNTDNEDGERASDGQSSRKIDSKEGSEERHVRELDISRKPNETPKEPDVFRKPQEALELSLPSTSAVDIRAVIQESMREVLREQNRSAALSETERVLRTELERKIRGLDSDVRQRTESLSLEISLREEIEQKYAALQNEFALASERAERDLALLEEARDKIIWFETELEVRESQSLRLEEVEQRAKKLEEELERVKTERESTSTTKIPKSNSSNAETENRVNTTDDKGDDELDKKDGFPTPHRSDSMAVEEMNVVLGQLGRTQTDLAALKDYNSRLLSLLKRLDRDLPTLSTSALGTDSPSSATPSRANSETSEASPAEGSAREFTFDAFFQRVQSLAHENRVLLKQVHELQKRNEFLVIQMDEFSDRISPTGKCSEESARDFETQRARFEEDQAKLSERVGELEAELTRVSETHFDEVRKISEESGRAKEMLREEASRLKLRIEELEAELVHRRKTAEAFESDRRALEARAESASVKASRYRNELSEAQLKAFMDAAAGLAIDGAESLKREFRKVMNDLRSEHAEQVRVESEERWRLERLVAELRRENEEAVATLAKAWGAASKHDVSEDIKRTSEHEAPSSNPPVPPPRPPVHHPLPSVSQPGGQFRVHHPNDSSLSIHSTGTSSSFHSVRSTSPDRRIPELDAEKPNHDHHQRHHHPVSYTLRDNAYPLNDAPNPTHRPEVPPVPRPRTKLPSKPASPARHVSAPNPPHPVPFATPDATAGHRLVGTASTVKRKEEEEEPDDYFGPALVPPHRSPPRPLPTDTSQDRYRQEVALVPPPLGSHPATSAATTISSQPHPYPCPIPQPQQQQQNLRHDPHAHRPERSLPSIPQSETTEKTGKGTKKLNRFTFLGGR